MIETLQQTEEFFARLRSNSGREQSPVVELAETTEAESEEPSSPMTSSRGSSLSLDSTPYHTAGSEVSAEDEDEELMSTSEESIDDQDESIAEEEVDVPEEEYHEDDPGEDSSDKGAGQGGGAHEDNDQIDNDQEDYDGDDSHGEDTSDSDAYEEHECADEQNFAPTGEGLLPPPEKGDEQQQARTDGVRMQEHGQEDTVTGDEARDEVSDEVRDEVCGETERKLADTTEIEAISNTGEGHMQIIAAVRVHPVVEGHEYSDATSRNVQGAEILPMRIDNVTAKDLTNQGAIAKLLARIQEVNSTLMGAPQVPLQSARFYIKVRYGKMEFWALIDSGANVSLVDGTFLEELESQSGGRLQHHSQPNITVLDHQSKAVPLVDLVQIPLQTLSRTVTVPFLVQASKEKPTNHLDWVLLGANFLQGARVQLVWREDAMIAQIDGEPGTATTLMQEKAARASTLQLQAREVETTLPWMKGEQFRAQVIQEKRIKEVVDAGADAKVAPPGATQTDMGIEATNALPKQVSTTGMEATNALPSSAHGGKKEVRIALPTEISEAEALAEGVLLGEQQRNGDAGWGGQPTSACLFAQPQKTSRLATDPTVEKETTEGVPEELFEIPTPFPLQTEEEVKKRPTSWVEVVDLELIREDRRDFMRGIFSTHPSIVSLHSADVGLCTDERYEFTLNLPPDFKLQRHKPYNCPPESRKVINGAVDSWLVMDVVESSTSIGCVPMFCVGKKVVRGAGDLVMKLRPVCNVRPQNAATETWPNTLPHLHHLCEELAGASFLSSVDMSNAYMNFKIKESERHHVTFITPDGRTYQFKRLCFGLKNAGAFFSWAIRSIMEPLRPHVLVYLDDILLFSKTIEEHDDLLKRFAALMDKYGLKLSPKKCHFYQSQLDFVGFRVDGNGVHLGEEKVRAVRDFERPTSLKKTQGFLGLCNFLGRHLPRYQEVAAPLTDLTKGEVKFQWTDEQEEAFQQLKDLVCRATMLAHPKFDEPMHLFTDASCRGLGAGLFQYETGTPEEIAVAGEPSPEHLVPLAFHSRKFNEVQQRYSTIEQEALAIFDSLKSMEYYSSMRPRWSSIQTPRRCSGYCPTTSPAATENWKGTAPYSSATRISRCDTAPERSTHWQTPCPDSTEMIERGDCASQQSMLPRTTSGSSSTSEERATSTTLHSSSGMTQEW